MRGERQLFSGLNCELQAQTLLEVRGANGSGKTSLLRMICGLIFPAAGDIRWDGRDIYTLGEAYRDHITYVGHASAIKDDLTPAENLRFAIGLAGIRPRLDAIDAALSSLGLDNFRHAPCRTLSQGQRRRVALARLPLSSEKPLWILDEPFAALDTTAIALTQKLIENRVTRGGIVIVTSHQDVSIKAPLYQRIELAA